MVKVMLVDDDYPVLDLLAFAIEWEELGFQLLGMHENGEVALAAALEEMPDILITDIGMPRMDGLELIRRLKERKPELRVAVLSCHDEFRYAQQALKLQVQDYLLKDTLDPSDIRKLLLQFQAELNETKDLHMEQLRKEHMVDRNKALLKEQFIRATLHQPMLDPVKWQQELGAFGLPFGAGELVIPVLGIIDDYPRALQRFRSEEVLRFVVDNVTREVMASREHGRPAAHFVYSPQESFIMQVCPQGLKINGFDEVKLLLAEVQRTLRSSLKLTMSFLIGDSAGDPLRLREALAELLSGAEARFYRAPGSIGKVCAGKAAQPAKAGSDNPLLERFGEAAELLREALLGHKREAAEELVRQWLSLAEQRRLPPEQVKDWVFKLLLDVKLKLQLMQHTRSASSIDVSHHEVWELGSLAELQEWLIAHCLSAITASENGVSGSKRAEVIDACEYVSQHLDKKISLDEVADQLFMNPSYFSRLFKKEMGETFIEYVIRMKMHRAKELLDQTGSPIGKICETLGYDNQSYFIKLFKSCTGVTPVEYRRGQKRL